MDTPDPFRERYPGEPELVRLDRSMIERAGQTADLIDQALHDLESSREERRARGARLDDANALLAVVSHREQRGISFQDISQHYGSLVYNQKNILEFRVDAYKAAHETLEVEQLDELEDDYDLCLRVVDDDPRNRTASLSATLFEARINARTKLSELVDDHTDKDVYINALVQKVGEQVRALREHMDQHASILMFMKRTLDHLVDISKQADANIMSPLSTKDEAYEEVIQANQKLRRMMTQFERGV